MTEQSRQTDELAAEEQELASRLERQRPLPRAGFRRALRRHLAAHGPAYGPRPERLMVAGYAGVGACLIALGALVATGVL